MCAKKTAVQLTMISCFVAIKYHRYTFNCMKLLNSVMLTVSVRLLGSEVIVMLPVTEAVELQ